MAPKSTPLTDEQKAALLSATTEFHIARSQAINAYAEMEQRLGMVFNHLLAAGPQKSSAVFGSLQNQRNRLVLIGRLIHINFGDRYDTFFDSFALLLSKIDSTRNNIVHWIMLRDPVDETKFNPRKNIYLAGHPDFFHKGKMYRHELIDFRKKCEFYRNLLQNFWVIIRIPGENRRVDPGKRPWTEIFLERAVYPPPVRPSTIPDPQSTRTPALVIAVVISISV